MSKTPGQINYETWHKTMHGHASGAFKLLSARQRLAWETAAKEVIESARESSVDESSVVQP